MIVLTKKCSNHSLKLQKLIGILDHMDKVGCFEVLYTRLLVKYVKLYMVISRNHTFPGKIYTKVVNQY